MTVQLTFHVSSGVLTTELMIHSRKNSYQHLHQPGCFINLSYVKELVLQSHEILDDINIVYLNNLRTTSTVGGEKRTFSHLVSYLQYGEGYMFYQKLQLNMQCNGQ